MNDISFLLGSGFSVPAEHPTTSKINERLHKISADEICITPSKSAWFLNGQKDVNVRMSAVERTFVQSFLEFYNAKVLKPGEAFHYETFFDYYFSYMNDGREDPDIETFLQSFKHESPPDAKLLNFVRAFHLTFSQLVAQLLTKALPNSHLGRIYPQEYRHFLFLIEKLSKTHRVHFHSLNHDLYLERLAVSDAMHSKLSDGFTELGSPYYGWMRNKFERYMVRLARFENKFDQPFCLYKLHGSIDNYWFPNEEKREMIKLKRGISECDLYKEIERNGELEYKSYAGNVYPDFLSGTTSKIKRYGRGEYYPVIFDHFENNLRSSNTLIIIGYGFGDQKINDYISNSFLSSKNKAIFIIDIKKPETEFLNFKNAYFIDGGVTEMDYQYILKKMIP